MEKEIRKATSIIDSFFGKSVSSDKEIPAELFKGCKGIAFLTVVKAGFIWSGKFGSGIVLSKLQDGSWSPPSAIGTAGVGFGAEIGGEIVDFMIILGSNSAVKAFKKGTQVAVGAGLDLAVGPFGRAAAVNVNAGGSGLSANYTYCRSKGLFAGVGLHGSTFIVRGELNSKFYGANPTPMQILSGEVPLPNPQVCELLYEALRKAGTGENESMEERQYAVATRVDSSSSSQWSRNSSGSVASSALGNSKNGSDARIHRYQSYKTEEELYAEFSKRKSVSEDNTLKSEPIPNLPEEAVGSDKRDVFTQVMDIITSQGSHVDVNKFKDQCRMYGQDEISLSNFFQYLKSLGSVAMLQQLMPKLVKLLPTEEKRREFWNVYTDQVWKRN